jgi:hypothetical protein
LTAAQPPKAAPRGRSRQPGVYAGRYLSKKSRERRALDSEDDFRRRAQFMRGRDVAYRRALGLADDEPLPAAIGQTAHNREPKQPSKFAA